MLTGFSCKKIHERFAGTGKRGRNTKAAVIPQQSPPMPRKNLAKMAAALYACEELHKIDELDDNLLPVCPSDESESEEEEEAESGGKKKTKAGTKKRRRRYGRKVRYRVS